MIEITRFSSQTRIFGDTALVMLSGECDASSAQVIDDCSLDAVGSGARHLIVDLAEASFVDSSTVQALFLASARMSEVGGDVCLVRCPGIARLSTMAGAEQAFTLAGSLAGALRIMTARSRLAAGDVPRPRPRANRRRFLGEPWAPTASSFSTVPPLAAA
ncbi:MAG: STAS domain-containing protein [Gaiellaceae bacterium]